jgi:hypothetical protein
MWQAGPIGKWTTMMNLKQAVLGYLVLSVGNAICAADAQWPQNHSIVYVAARFPETRPPMVGGDKPPDLPALAECSPLDIYRRAGFVILTDDGGIQRWLAKKEDWRPLLHATKQACEDYVKAHGRPRVVSYMGEINRGNTFRIAPSGTESAK